MKYEIQKIINRLLAVTALGFFIAFCIGLYRPTDRIDDNTQPIDPKTAIHDQADLRCYDAATLVLESRYRKSYTELIEDKNKELSVVIVGGTEFRFKKNDDLVPGPWLSYIHDKNGKKIYIPGLTAYAVVDAAEFAKNHPDVITTDYSPGDRIGVTLNCQEKVYNGFYKDFEKILKDEYKPGYVEYVGDNQIKGMEVLGETNPDGSPVYYECFSGFGCNMFFNLTPEVQLVVRFPFRQAKDWKRIQKYMVNHLLNAKVP
jgi:hypothetical protein